MGREVGREINARELKEMMMERRLGPVPKPDPELADALAGVIPPQDTCEDNQCKCEIGADPKIGIGGGPTRATILPTDAAGRKQYPVATGVLDYFPDAIAAISHLSYVGNVQHNPGQPLHWARGKSTDEDDTMMRHFLQRGTMDVDGVRHSVKMAWRALAILQKELEAERERDVPNTAFYRPKMQPLPATRFKVEKAEDGALGAKGRVGKLLGEFNQQIVDECDRKGIFFHGLRHGKLMLLTNHAGQEELWGIGNGIVVLAEDEVLNPGMKMKI